MLKNGVPHDNMVVFLSEIQDQIAEVISDYITEKTGFCHKGFDCKIQGNRVVVSNIQWDTEED